jgi:hypothetical protein
MKKILILTLILFAFTANAQLIENLPKNEKGELYKSEIVNVPGLDKAELFSAMSQLFADMFAYPEAATHLSDKETGIIVLKSFDKVSSKVSTEHLWFTLKVECRDERYKIELYDFYYKDPDNGREYTVDYYLSIKNFYKSNGNPKIFYEAIRQTTVEKIDELLATVSSKITDYKSQEW